MTKPRYSPSCAAGSKVNGLSREMPGNGQTSLVWGVNFNNGNVNNYNRNNSGFCRFVRGGVAAPGECLSGVSFRGLVTAYEVARKGKKPSGNRLRFDMRWAPELLRIEREIRAGIWQPSRPLEFVAKGPKARQIHAPIFADRVVQHWATEQLERELDPMFIEDSYGNREGKGTHAAVERLGGMVRQVHSGQGGGWYWQADVSTCFPSIDRRKLWKRLKPLMERKRMSPALMYVVHALLRRSSTHDGVVHLSSPAERARIPHYKRLENAKPGCGLPIGARHSQFFANFYLDPLDQFVKRVLGVQRYIRYVDDIVLIHQSREQLEAWRDRIVAFLRDELALELKAEQKLLPLTAGIDFLGYVVFPTHSRVRRRVVSHARDRFEAWGARHVRGSRIRATPAQYRDIQSATASYMKGHFAHAATHKLRSQLHQQFPWLAAASMTRRFHHSLEGQYVNTSIPEGRARA